MQPAFWAAENNRFLEWNEDNKKKKTTGYQEQDQQKVAAYQNQIQDVPLEKIAYVDECGIDTYLYREYGYAPRRRDNGKDFA